jgi:hypothetical protein
LRTSQRENSKRTLGFIKIFYNRACNPSFCTGEVWSICSLRPGWAKCSQDSFSINKSQVRGSMVECLSSRHEALRSNFSTIKKKKNQMLGKVVHTLPEEDHGIGRRKDRRIMV